MLEPASEAAKLVLAMNTLSRSLPVGPWLTVALLASHSAFAAAFHNPYGKLPTNATPADRIFVDYFRAETSSLAERSLAGIATLEDWKQQQPKLRRQLFEMLGLDPLPPKTDLKATITGTLDHPAFT